MNCFDNEYTRDAWIAWGILIDEWKGKCAQTGWFYTNPH